MLFNFSQISSEDLLLYNKQGWLPGPKEEEKEYLQRIKALYHFMSYPPSDIDQFLTDTEWQGVHEILYQCYDIRPDWIIVYYRNAGLNIFEGAATWIMEQDQVRIPIVQLKEKFMSGKMWKIYHRDEIIAHEAIHAVRMQFDDPYFEEIFAYKTSPFFFRRVFGPLFQKPWESTLLLALLLLPLIGVSLQLFFEKSFLWPFLFWIPVIYVGILLLRLLTLRCVLALALSRLRSFLKEPKKNWAVALRLTDREIFRCAFQKKKTLEQFFKSQKSLRWKYIEKAYLK